MNTLKRVCTIFVLVFVFLTNAKANTTIKLKPSHTLLGAMRRMHCSTLWLSEVMNQNNIEEKKLHFLRPNTRVTLPKGVCHGKPNNEIALATMKILAHEHGQEYAVAEVQETNTNPPNTQAVNTQPDLTPIKKQSDVVSQPARAEGNNTRLLLGAGAGGFLVSSIMWVLWYFLWLKRFCFVTKKEFNVRKGKDFIHFKTVKPRCRKDGTGDEVRIDRLWDHIVKNYPDIGMETRDYVSRGKDNVLVT